MDFSELHALGASEETHKLERVERTTRLVEAAGLYPSYRVVTSAATEPTCQVEGRELVMLCSNNYLGLARHPAVVEGARLELERHGLGPGGSRVLCGNLAVLGELEARIADLVGAEDAVTLPTGYMANVGAINGLLDPILGVLPYRKGAAAVISDERNHGTLFDGMALSHAKRFLYAHNDLEDLVSKLERARDHSPRMIVTEGVYSVDGEVTPLPQIAEIARRHDAILMVDDAHGVGVLGAHGGGTLEHFGMEGQADLVMGSFDKALGGMGGWLAGRKEVVKYLRMSSHPYMTSSAVPAVMAGAMIRAIETCVAGQELRERLRTNASYLRGALGRLGFRILGDGTLPVVPVVIGGEEEAIAFSERLFELGVFLPCFRWPSVPKGTARVRATVTALHRPEHLQRAVDAFRQAGRELGMAASAA
ncbi:MAG TPA: aminotransferase class I/II-fold pyridoxal phosphate-dependent enzyme [Anaeromyxobacter sp.]|nr:aminotransferase class I/II-fold pyridoxal phosphate-dependent enzyme [Anaeromyxobacter sp.]